MPVNYFHELTMEREPEGLQWLIIMLTIQGFNVDFYFIIVS